MINTTCPHCAEHWGFSVNDWECARRFSIHQEACKKKQETITITHPRTGATFEMTVEEFKERFPQASKQVFSKTICATRVKKATKTEDEDPSNV
jgi:hypothetical protein